VTPSSGLFLSQEREYCVCALAFPENRTTQRKATKQAPKKQEEPGPDLNSFIAEAFMEFFTCNHGLR
jgi:hypothetical protein